MEITISTTDRTDIVDITDRVAEAVPDGIDGGCSVFVAHTTAGITVQEAERRLLGDIEDTLDSLIPDDGHAHDALDDNADSHLRAMLVGASETVPVRDGALALGTWQSLLLVECDGPRERTVRVTVTPT
jgi:secondary thiamine-phosphate synthase enzyme